MSSLRYTYILEHPLVKRFLLLGYNLSLGSLSVLVILSNTLSFFLTLNSRFCRFLGVESYTIPTQGLQNRYTRLRLVTQEV